LLTDRQTRQTDKQTKSGKNITSLAEVIIQNAKKTHYTDHIHEAYEWPEAKVTRSSKDHMANPLEDIKTKAKAMIFCPRPQRQLKDPPPMFNNRTCRNARMLCIQTTSCLWKMCTICVIE